MPPRRLLRGFVALWAISGIVLLYASVSTVVGALGRGGREHPHAVLLGTIEAVAALLFLVVSGAVVAFIALHGPLSRAQWHAAISPTL